MWPCGERTYALIAVLTLFKTSSASTYKAAWTTDCVHSIDDCRPHGPDGPWQAVSVGLGVTGNFTTVALYPSGSYTSDILTSSAGGQYSPEERMANNTGAGNATNAVPILYFCLQNYMAGQR